MKFLNRALILAIAITGSSAFAGYAKIGGCNGVTDKGISASLNVFVNQAANTAGILVATFADGTMKLSDTRVDWNTNPQGFPHFFDNDFDLDIVIAETGVSSDDVVVGEEYVSKLDCSYQP